MTVVSKAKAKREIQIHSFAMDTAYWVRVALNESASCQTSEPRRTKPSSVADTDTVLCYKVY